MDERDDGLVAIVEEPSESTSSSNAHEESEADDNNNVTRKPQSESSALSMESVGSTASTSITGEDVLQAREEFQRNLQEEQMLTGLQMQLMVQLDKLNASIASAQSEERIAKLAMQQAETIRLIKKAQDPNSDVDNEAITIKLRK